MSKNETLLLVAVRGTMHQIVAEGIPSFLQSIKTNLKKQPQWRGFDFRIRTKAGYKARPLWKKGEGK